ncbi:MAG: tetratricopeptide repeat protein, partial [Candidatus Eremiobacterota bacterium]
MKNFRLLIILIIFLFLFQCFSLQGQAAKEVEKLVDRAVELIKEKNYKEALQILEEAKNKDKNYWPIYLYKGMAYHFNTDYSNAIIYYKVFIKYGGKNPKMGIAFYNIGDCYYRTDKKKEAIEYLEKARAFFYNNNERDYYIRSLKKLA